MKPTELAAVLNVSVPTVSRWINAKVPTVTGAAGAVVAFLSFLYGILPVEFAPLAYRGYHIMVQLQKCFQQMDPQFFGLIKEHYDLQQEIKSLEGRLAIIKELRHAREG